jgi:hypothetical protein
VDNLEFWGSEGEYRPSTLADQWTANEDIAAEVMAADHLRLDDPGPAVLMHRQGEFGHVTRTESLWVNGYPAARLITVTVLPIPLPDGGEVRGVVKEIPVGWRDMGSPDAFRERLDAIVRTYRAEGWQPVPSVIPWSGDPWDVPSTLDDDPTF